MAKDRSGRNGSGSAGTGEPKGPTAAPSKEGQAGGPPNGQQAHQNGDQPKNKPVHEIRMGRICGAIWPQQGNEGQIWHNVTLCRIYRDNDGKRSGQTVNTFCSTQFSQTDPLELAPLAANPGRRTGRVAAAKSVADLVFHSRGRREFLGLVDFGL